MNVFTLLIGKQGPECLPKATLGCGGPRRGAQNCRSTYTLHTVLLPPAPPRPPPLHSLPRGQAEQAWRKEGLQIRLTSLGQEGFRSQGSALT